MKTSSVDNFWKRVSKGAGCWEWTGYRKSRGYGHTWFNGKLTLAHRVSWQLTHGPIPDGACVLHKCDNPPCVRLEHMYLGTKQDNARDMCRRGRHADISGEKHPRALLTTEQVAEIRCLFASGQRQCDLARRFRVNYRTIHAIVRNHKWRVRNAI